jgi:hypothetical protein
MHDRLVLASNSYLKLHVCITKKKSKFKVQKKKTKKSSDIPSFGGLLMLIMVPWNPSHNFF